MLLLFLLFSERGWAFSKIFRHKRRVCFCNARRDNNAAMRRQCEDLEADEAELNAKIKKKRNELERGEKRLKSLQVRGGEKGGGIMTRRKFQERMGAMAKRNTKGVNHSAVGIVILPCNQSS